MNSLIKKYESNVIPLNKEKNLAYFKASISGNDSDYKKSAKAQIALDKIYSDKAMFADIKNVLESGEITDPTLMRQLDIIYLAYLGKQIDEKTLEELINRQSAIEQKFNSYRTKVNGQELSDNLIDSILKNSTNSVELKETWEASKRIGHEVAMDIIELAKLRNKAARSVGFPNYYEMQMSLGEQDPADIIMLFDQLDSLTRGVFETNKEEIDSVLSSQHNVRQSQLQPWHYQDRFFKEALSIYDVNLDLFYQDKDPIEIVRAYFAGIGLSVDNILSRSDLYERTGKTQSAECINIDRAGDVRTICNMRANYYWTEVLLHELGHGVYDYHNDQQESWLLRNVAHPCTTEAVAAFFGRLAGNFKWLVQVAGVLEGDAARFAGDVARMNRSVQLNFSRFVQVMVRFERGLYGDTDQDLNKLWWDLIEKYQGLTRPEGRSEPDWACKIHIITDPVYYHNYLIAELLASQFAETIGSKVLKLHDPYSASFADNPRIGKFFKERVFHPGSSLPWNEMIQKATGENLSAKYYAKQFLEK